MLYDVQQLRARVQHAVLMPHGVVQRVQQRAPQLRAVRRAPPRRRRLRHRRQRQQREGGGQQRRRAARRAAQRG